MRWYNRLKSAKDQSDPILVRTWVLPLNTNPLAGSWLPAVNEAHQTVPAYLHRCSIVHARFLTLTSMTTVTSGNFGVFSSLVTIFVTETSCDCLAWLGGPVCILSPKCHPKANRFPPLPKGQLRVGSLLPSHLAHMLQCGTRSDSARSTGGFRRLLGEERRMEGHHCSSALPGAGRQSLPCMVMVRMLTALRALCLWKGSPCSSK